jgi:UDP-N-acetylglucosamine--N-acetylmuramyl-(pentapeptide) pyrophosphoryl-undecaprenol N-acetylglucosamine transferase
MGIPSLIQEQNSFPGITNKLLSGKVNRICVAYWGMEKYFPKDKIIITGNPVRQDILTLEGKKEGAMKFFGLDSGKKTVLVIGGSLGARTINESMALCLDSLLKNNLQVIWQTGKSYSYGSAPEGAWIGPFITKMDLAYAIADIVVSRAGAISLSELAIVKKPSILVPSPNVAEDHQTKNAMALVKNDAAILVKDADSKESLGKKIIALMNDELMQKKLSNNIGKLAFPNAAELIAKEVINLTGSEK